MPVIHIEYDDTKVKEAEMQVLGEAAQRIVSEVTGIEDVFVYGRSALIKIKIAPIEIFVQISAHKVPDIAVMLAEIKKRVASWKSESAFPHPINLTLARMDWQFEIGI